MNSTVKATVVPPCVDRRGGVRHLLLKLLALMEEGHIDQDEAE